MTTLTVVHLAAAPTPFERALLRLSSRLSRTATTRMQRRAAAARRHELRTEAADAQRDRSAVSRSGLLPR